MTPTAMISGHLDLTPEEFQEHYAERIFEAMKAGHDLIVGDARGADTLAQEFMTLNYGFSESRVSVFHMFDKPRNLVCNQFDTVEGFKSDEQRDFEMTMQSTYDIAWVRPGREKSGTAKNIERRNIKDRMVARYDQLVEAVYSDSPVRLTIHGELNNAAEYEKRIVAAICSHNDNEEHLKELEEMNPAPQNPS